MPTTREIGPPASGGILSVSITISGDKELEKKLDKLLSVISGADLHRILSESAKVGENVARGAAPVSSGALQRSIRSDVSTILGGERITLNISGDPNVEKYAATQELGSTKKLYPINPKGGPGSWLKFIWPEGGTPTHSKFPLRVSKRKYPIGNPRWKGGGQPVYLPYSVGEKPAVVMHPGQLGVGFMQKGGKAALRAINLRINRELRSLGL